MPTYIMRLDDAAPHANWKNWEKIEQILSFYHVKPLVGVIPNCMDTTINALELKRDFWSVVHHWEQKGWDIAMHGYDHVYISEEGGFNPVNDQSEFAGVSLEIQREKIREGFQIFRDHGIEPKVFFAPSHTMDFNTIKALKAESSIRIISDTIASDSYCKWGITFVPQQTGKVRKLPCKIVTFCYHPNVMEDHDFEVLENFLKAYRKRFVSFPTVGSERKRSIYDRVLEKLYFCRR